MYRLKRIIENMKYAELAQIKKDLEEGGFEIKKIVEEKIRHYETTHEKSCSVCYNSLEPFSTNNYTLVFGPDDFRKKASFCALDCLQYFLENLKNIKGGV